MTVASALLRCATSTLSAARSAASHSSAVPAKVTYSLIARASAIGVLMTGFPVARYSFIFSGEIYFSVFTGNHTLIMLAPVGGTSMIVGWILLAFAKPGERA